MGATNKRTEAANRQRDIDDAAFGRTIRIMMTLSAKEIDAFLGGLGDDFDDLGPDEEPDYQPAGDSGKKGGAS